MGAGKYRKRPVIVEAMQINDINAAEVAAWCGGEAVGQSVVVPTMHGEIPAHPTDWVIRGIVDFYPMTARQFPDAFVGETTFRALVLTDEIQGLHAVHEHLSEDEFAEAMASWAFRAYELMLEVARG